jgi:hypothetical protein
VSKLVSTGSEGFWNALFDNVIDRCSIPARAPEALTR